jgi:uncharacterized RDD family membrane protein YckC
MPEVTRPSGPPVVDNPVRPAEPEVEENELENGALAPVNTRLLAGLIDGVVVVGLSFVVLFVLPDVLEKFAWVVAGAYWIVRDSLPFMKAQSVGKMAMKLKVMKLGGGTLESDWQAALVRNAVLLVPFFGPLVEIIVLLSRDGKPERGKRLGDEWAKTKVVVHRPEESLAE